MKDFSHYSLLADLFFYPESDFAERVRRVQEFVDKNYSEEASQLQGFTDFISKASQNERQELHTRTFDVQSLTTLDVGYVLFGDDYKRGELLANLNREHNKAKINCRGELADHLPNVLRLISKIEDEELLQELVEELLDPALQNMIGEFNPERIQKKNKMYKKHYKTIIETIDKYALIYEKPLKVLHALLKKDFVIAEKEVIWQTSDFLNSIGKEIEIEKISKE